jgi:hypothetical protein
MFVVYTIMVVIIAFISWRWVKAIDYMKENHPDYKGEDFLNWDDIPNTAGRDGWDDNSVHTEGDF